VGPFQGRPWNLASIRKPEKSSNWPPTIIMSADDRKIACIGQLESSRQAPSTILLILLRPVGKSAARQANRRTGEQAFVGERFGEFLGGVEHHFDNASDVAVSGRQRTNAYAKAMPDGRTDLLSIEVLAFDLARLHSARLRSMW
jgi:hypothetical protein